MDGAIVPARFESIVIDTLSQLQNDLYLKLLKEKGRAGFDEWKDFGVEILDFYTFLRESDITIVQVLGYEGSGKTVGGSFLNPATNVWFNIDKKPLTFGHKTYPKDSVFGKVNSKGNYIEVSDYGALKTNITAINSKSNNRLVCFVLNHIEDYNTATGPRQRLKVLGKMATKHNIEGAVVHTYYTNFDVNRQGQDRYRLIPNGTGYNTARSPMGMFDEEESIPNNFKLILDEINKNR